MGLDKATLGERYVCFSCETKFYDLNRPKPKCPSCGTDQRDRTEDAEAPKTKAPAAPKPAKTASKAEAEAEELLDTVLNSDTEDDESQEDDGLAELGVPEMSSADDATDED